MTALDVGHILVPAFLLGLCVWLVTRWVRVRWLLRASSSWPRAQGSVVSVYLYPGGPRTPPAMWFTYEYHVGGEYYSGAHSLSLLDKTHPEQDYPRGRPLLVRYQPSNPSASVLAEEEQPPLPPGLPPAQVLPVEEIDPLHLQPDEK